MSEVRVQWYAVLHPWSSVPPRLENITRFRAQFSDGALQCLGFLGHSFEFLQGCIRVILLMILILHCLKDPKLWEFWYIPYYG